MTSDGLPCNEELGENIRRHLDDGEASGQRLAELEEAMHGMAHGPVRELLREIVRAYDEFVVAEESGGTTVGEERRMHRLLRSAMTVPARLG